MHFSLLSILDGILMVMLLEIVGHNIYNRANQIIRSLNHCPSM